MQNCCNGRSKKYRKWHFWGCSLSETLQRIDIKFGRDDYVCDGSQHAKWHINRFRGVISAKGWSVNGLCFFIFILFLVRPLAPLGVKPLDRFWRVIRQNACFWVSCIPFGVRTMTSQFCGVKSSKNRLKLARNGVFQPKCRSLKTAISPKVLMESSRNLYVKQRPKGANKGIQN